MGYIVGRVYKRDGKNVYITSGDYEINGRISNHWGWREVNENGSLGEKGCGYGDSDAKSLEADIEIKVKLR